MKNLAYLKRETSLNFNHKLFKMTIKNNMIQF
jgi:hypothetical protein